MFSVVWQNGEDFEPELGLEICVSPDTLKTANKTKNSPMSPFSHLKAKCFFAVPPSFKHCEISDSC